MTQTEVLIVGGGIAGITCALELENFGISVTLVEKDEKLGGLAADFCCKASHVCNKCFACVVDKKIKEIQNKSDITSLLGWEFTGVRANSAGWIGTLKSNKGHIEEIYAQAIVIAGGIDPFEATLKGEYGYGIIKNVITARDLEVLLREKGEIRRPSDQRYPQKIAFIQCVGSRDAELGNLYCSEVCCAYALRMIASVNYRQRDIQFSFFYMDIQPAGANFHELLSRLRGERNVRFIRSLPSKIYHQPLNDTLAMKFIEPLSGEITEEVFDLVVLSVGMTLRKELKDLPFTQNEDGFLREDQGERGIFLTGACLGPKDIERSITHAKAVSSQVYDYLKSR